METMTCDGTTCRPVYDYDHIILRDILESFLNNNVVNGWVNLDLAVEEVQMLLQLVREKLQ